MVIIHYIQRHQVTIELGISHEQRETEQLWRNVGIFYAKQYLFVVLISAGKLQMHFLVQHNLLGSPLSDKC